MTRHSHIHRLAPALLATCALGAAACGETRTFVGDYNDAVTALRLTPATANPHDAAPALTRQASEVHAFRVRIAALKPPPNARQPFNQLLAAVDRYSTELTRFAHATRAGNPSRIENEGVRVAQDIQALGEAEQAVAAAVEH